MKEQGVRVYHISDNFEALRRRFGRKEKSGKL